MKKENKKMAQERRAAERKKQATMRLVRNTLIIALIVAFFVGMIVYGVIDSRKQKAAEAEDAQQQATRSISIIPAVLTVMFSREEPQRDRI